MSKLHTPPVAVVVPLEVTPSKSSTVLPDSAVPVKVNRVVFWVMLSVDDDPVSSAASRSGVEGVVGAVASIVIERLLDADDTFPAASVCVALMLA